MSPRTRGVLLAMSSFLSSRGISNAMNDYMTNYRTVYQMFGNSSCREHSLGAFHFFAHRREVIKYREKTRKERREHENQEEQTGAKSADAAGKRRTTRRTGDDAMEERTPASDMGRDRSGGG